MGSSVSSERSEEEEQDPRTVGQDSFRDLYHREKKAWESFFRIDRRGGGGKSALFQFPVTHDHISALFVAEYLPVPPKGKPFMEKQFLDQLQSAPKVRSLQRIKISGEAKQKILRTLKVLGSGSYGEVREMQPFLKMPHTSKNLIKLHKLKGYRIAMKTATVLPLEEPIYQTIAHNGEVSEAAMSFALSQLQLPGFPLFFASFLVQDPKRSPGEQLLQLTLQEMMDNTLENHLLSKDVSRASLHQAIFQICFSYGVAHQNIGFSHMDLKPNNVMQQTFENTEKTVAFVAARNVIKMWFRSPHPPDTVQMVYMESKLEQSGMWKMIDFGASSACPPLRLLGQDVLDRAIQKNQKSKDAYSICLQGTEFLDILLPAGESQTAEYYADMYQHFYNSLDQKSTLKGALFKPDDMRASLTRVAMEEDYRERIKRTTKTSILMFLMTVTSKLDENHRMDEREKDSMVGELIQMNPLCDCLIQAEKVFTPFPKDIENFLYFVQYVLPGLVPAQYQHTASSLLWSQELHEYMGDSVSFEEPVGSVRTMERKLQEGGFPRENSLVFFNELK